VVAVCLAALAVLVVVLFVAGANKNAQINQLRQHGVAVQVTVSGCFGLLGGSGSNGAGYACRGTFTLDGHRYNEAIPGNVFRTTGTKVSAVAVSGNPPLLSTHHAVATQHASSSVYIVPIILLVVLLLLLGALVLRRRRGREAAPAGASGAAL
jgi:MYXO-CTERM domain-containing protein